MFVLSVCVDVIGCDGFSRIRIGMHVMVRMRLKQVVGETRETRHDGKEKSLSMVDFDFSLYLLSRHTSLVQQSVALWLSLSHHSHIDILKLFVTHKPTLYKHGIHHSDSSF